MHTNDPAAGHDLAAAASALPDWPNSPANSGRPLAGVRVLDLSRIVAGPLCAMLLADLGADVVKVESPSGDEVRRWGPPFHSDTATYFFVANRNKWSVVLDLKSEAGRHALAALAAQAHVVISNFTDDIAAALGVDFAAIAAANPAIVYLAISGYGPAHGSKPGFDLIAQASSGLMSVTGPVDGPASKVGVAISDISAANFATIAVLSELVRRGHVHDSQDVARTQRAVRLDVSLQDATLSMLTNHAAGWLVAGTPPSRSGNDHPSVAPYGLFRTADGEIAIAVGTDRQFRQFCTAIGLEALATDRRFMDNRSRVANIDALRELMETALTRRTSQDWQVRLDGLDVPNGPIRSVPEALSAADPDFIQSIEFDGVEVAIPANPIRIDGEYLTPYLPPPGLGQHTDQIIGRMFASAVTTGRATDEDADADH